MPTIKKIGLLVILMVLLSLVPLAGESPGAYRFSLSPLVGFLYGQGVELLYKYPDSDHLMSELLWDLKPLLYAGLAIDYGPVNFFGNHGLFAGGSLKFGLPLNTGIMENRDWEVVGHEYLTHYSRHDAYSLGAILADVSIGHSWRMGSSFALGVFVEFSFMRFSWMGEDGFLQYSSMSGGILLPWDESIPKVEVTGPGIRYTQNWFIYSPGLSLRGRFNERLYLEGKLSYTPLVYVNARDDHFMKAKLFLDNAILGHSFAGGARFIINLQESLDLSLSASYRHISGLRGPSFFVDTGTVRRQTIQNYYDGGAGYSALDVELALRILLFRTSP